MYKLFGIITRNNLQADVVEDIIILELKMGVVGAVVARLH